MNHIRILPIVLFAAASLLVLKGMGLIRNGYYTLPATQVVIAGGGGAAAPDPGLAAALAAKSKPPKECAPVIGNLSDPKADNMLAVQLAERRKELDERMKEIELRENILAASEKKLADKQFSNRPSSNATTNTAQNGGGGGSQGRAQSAKHMEERPDQIRTLISMYDSMKPKDAGQIFDKLDMSVMSQLALELKPAKMGEILAQMSPDIAQKLTTELANQARRDKAHNQDGMINLPKIEGTMPKS